MVPNVTRARFYSAAPHSVQPTGQTPPVEKADFGASGAKVLLLYDMEGLTVASGRFVTKRAGVKRLALI